jgi:hypothetical protein
MCVCVCTCSAMFDVDFFLDYRILGRVLYWFVWTVWVPRWKGYGMIEEEEMLTDGTTIAKLVHKTK